MSTIRFRCIDDSENNVFIVDSSAGTTIFTTSDATNPTVGGALTVYGGGAFEKKVYIGDNLNVTGDINFTGGLYQNGVPFVSGGGGGGGTSTGGTIVVTAGSQWTSGVSGRIWYTGGNVGINVTSPSTNLEVGGTIKTDSVTFREGGVRTFAGTYLASKNIVTPTNITGLDFSPYASFMMTMNVNLVTNTLNLNSQYLIEGTKTSTGWIINDSAFGDVINITFSITSSGQLQYTSGDYILWVSTTCNYQITAVNVESNVGNITLPTSGNIVVPGKLNISDTTEANSVSSASLVLSGGLSAAKSLLIGGTLNLRGISNHFNGSFLGVNGNTTASSVTGLLFPNSTIRAFTFTISIDINKTDTNLYALKTFTGIQKDGTWVLNEESSIGDDTQLVFSISSSGQIEYISPTLVNWLSTTMNYSAVAYNRANNYESLPTPVTTVDGVILSNLNISSTQDAAANVTSASLSVSGGVSIGKNVVIGGSALSYGSGLVTNFAGNFIGANNTTGNVTGLLFPTDVYSSFVATINVRVRTQIETTVGQYTIEGTQTSTGWVINDSIFGDDLDISFSITPQGQIQYTSGIYANWVSTIMSYQVTAMNLSNNINILSVPNITSGNVVVPGTVNILNTADANTSSSASLVVSGGVTVSKNVVINENLYTVNSILIGTTTANPSAKLNVNGLIRANGFNTNNITFTDQERIYIPIDLVTFNTVEITLNQNYSGTIGLGRTASIRWSQDLTSSNDFTEYTNIVTRNPTAVVHDATNVLFHNIESGVNDSHCTIRLYKASVAGGRNALEVKGTYCWFNIGQSRVDATGYTTTIPSYIVIYVQSGTLMSGNYSIRNYI